MFKPIPKRKLRKIANKIIVLEKKKVRLLDILFEEDVIMAESILTIINNEKLIRS